MNLKSMAAAAAVSIAVLSVGVAVPSHAAAREVAIDCSLAGSVANPPTIPVTGVAGDTLTLRFASSCAVNYSSVQNAGWNIPGGFFRYADDTSSPKFTAGTGTDGREGGWWFGDTGAKAIASGEGVAVSVLAVSASGGSLAVGSEMAFVQVNNDFLVLVYAGEGSSDSATGGDSATGASTPETWLAVHQGLPMPTSGTCVDVQDADFSWGTGLSGGWQKSWQPWAGPTDSAGGWACIRTLVNRGGNTWSIASE